MKKVLVLGANGYLGSRLALALADKGYEVVAFVNKRFPYQMLLNVPRIETAEFVLESIEDLNNHPSLNGVDALYHFAWAGVNAQVRNEEDVQVQNVMFGIKVMEFAVRHDIKRVIVPGSAAEVSCGDGVITGKEMSAPSDMYSASKVAMRYVCQTYARLHNIDLIWTLITSIYGPGRNDNNLISYAIQSLLRGERPSFTGLEQQWDYLYVEDLMEAMILLGEKGIGGKVYPVGSGEHQQLNRYVEIIRNLINPKLPLGIGELPYKNPCKIDNQIMDIAEIINDTGFNPKWDFVHGIAVVINDYKNKKLSI
jgi:nucleoside-diphosphate-sugar epimerase